MTRTIKFRGKRLDTGEWVYGDLCHYNFPIGSMSITEPETLRVHEIDIATVGQFTGLLDKAGREVYEGDVVCYEKHPDLRVGPNAAVVVWEPGIHGNLVKFTDYDFLWRISACEVIGDIHTNPELLEGK